MFDLDTIRSMCGSVPALRGGLLVGLFATGAVGSVMHCVPMCGGFVLGQVAQHMARVPVGQLCEFQRLKAALVIPYHLGRLTTYAALGALAGRVAAWGDAGPWFLIGAAVLFLLFAMRRLAWLEHAPRAWGRLVGHAVRWLPSGSGLGAYGLGIALGFLPCGFLYAALTAAAASGYPAMGAAAMLAFGLGTLPALVVVGYVGRAAGLRWSRATRAAAPAVMVANAALLLMMAWRGLGS